MPLIVDELRVLEKTHHAFTWLGADAKPIAGAFLFQINLGRVGHRVIGADDLDEAAIAWHRGDLQGVQSILEPLLRRHEPATMSISLVCAACLAAAAGLRPSPQRLQALAKRATEVGAPKLAAQLIALLCIAVPARQRSLRLTLRRLRIRDAEPEWSRRREFMSLAEVARVLGDR